MSIVFILNALYMQSFVGAVLFSVVFVFYFVCEKRTTISLYPSLWFTFIGAMLVPWVAVKNWLSSTVTADTVWVDVVNATSFGKSVQQNVLLQSLQTKEILVGLWIVGVVVALFMFVVVPLIRQRRVLSRLEPVLLESKDRENILNVSTIFHPESNIVVYKGHLPSETPFVSGFFYSQLYIPAVFLKEADVDVVKGVLFHEESHVLKRDALRILIARIVVSLFWFLPFMYVALYMLRQTQEVAADHFALLRLNKVERLKFAKAMAIEALKFTSKETLLFRTAFNNHNHITRRLMMIKRFKTRGVLSTLLPIAILCGASLTAFAATGVQEKIHLKISGEITENGKVVSHPTIIVESGGKAKIVMGDNQKVFILEMLATHYDPNFVDVDMLVCVKPQGVAVGEDMSEETCDGIGKNVHFSGPLDFAFKTTENNYDFQFEISKLKIIKTDATH